MNIREAIKDAIKDRLVNGGQVVNILPIQTSWSIYAKDVDYPLAKVWATTSTPTKRFVSGTEMRTDMFYIVIAPFCTVDTFEEKISDLIIGISPILDTQLIRAEMDMVYQDQLGDVSITAYEPLDTDLLNPKGVLKITLEVAYRTA